MKRLSNLNIAARLAFGFGLVLSLAVMIAGFSIWQMNDIATASQAMAAPLAKERLIAEWNTQVFGAVRRTAAIVKSRDPAVAGYFKDEMEAAVRQSAALSKRIEPLLTAPAEAELLGKIDAQRKRYREVTGAAMKAKASGEQEIAEKILVESFAPAALGFQGLLEDLLALQHRQMDAQNVAILNIQTRSVRLLAALAAAAVLVGAACSWLLATGIVRPLRAAVDMAQTVASGDLSCTIEVHGNDETASLSRALRDMNDSLVGIVRRVRHGTDTIATASTEISNGNYELSSRTEQQASALEETAASMEELTAAVRQNADSAQQANQLSLAAAEITTRAGIIVDQVIVTMGSIDASAKQIGDITGVIDGIAFQTNILALNAAVEAARAGEQGRGFAVVAAEVRNLAQRSAAAAKQIKELIIASSTNVDTGATLVDQAGVAMKQVVGSIRRVTDIMAEISSAGEEQRSGIEQVNQAIIQMDQSTQQNAAMVERAAAAATSMQEQATQLALVVQEFKVEVVRTPSLRPTFLRAMG
jgi:methyl-accepting chemotaxis protein